MIRSAKILIYIKNVIIGKITTSARFYESVGRRWESILGISQKEMVKLTKKSI